ncbi:MAG TPA: MXAN_5187 C-terminal domain-containing protein [Pyrinomonadaceae bacterium]|nr:MXAN_5187 C-terminal domain-containing protein [Pyrinomonadaceae bacterium]
MSSRENKFARRAKELKERRGKSVTRGEAPPTIDEQLARLEEDIRRLKVEFDIFFNGGTKRPPYDTKGRVETIIKRLADERTFTFAQRYLYNTLVARFTSFRELWRRTMQGREEGRDAAANARQAAQQAAPHAPEAQAQTFICADPRNDVPTVKRLYDTLVEAKKQCGETVDDFSFSRFHRMIASKTDSLKDSLGCERVRFSVEVQEGRVSFKAKAEK